MEWYALDKRLNRGRPHVPVDGLSHWHSVGSLLEIVGEIMLIDCAI
jgi:hypothetical protein